MQRFHIHRFEFKYAFSHKQYNALKNELLNYSNYDPYCLRGKDKSYRVYSLYYDSPDLNSFWEKIDGIRNRKKFRLRVYDIDSFNKPDLYLEIKRKKDLVILKDRAKLDYSMYEPLRHGLTGALLDNLIIPPDQKKVVDEFIYNMIRFNLRPAVVVEYKREAFIGCHHNNVRITFDSDIRSYRSDDLFSRYRRMDTVLSNEVILELKFNGTLPSWFHRLIQKYDLSRQAHSKYCSSLIKSYNITI